MQLVNPLEQQNAVKTLYSEFVSPVCAKYGLTRIELDILLFLANNTRYDTATDIVEVRFLAKSQVSAAIKNLEARGCLRREYQLENRKTAHLRLCDPAQPMIAAGRSAQEQFGAALLDGFTPEELEHMQRSMERIRKNVEKYLEDKKMTMLIKFIVCFIAGIGAGLGTGFAGMSAAAVISPMLITFLDMPAYEAVGIALASDVLASAVSAYTYGKNKNLDIRNGIVMMVSVLCFTMVGSWIASQVPNSTMGSFSVFMTFLLGVKFIVKPVMTTKNAMEAVDPKKRFVQSVICGVMIGFICGFIGAGGGMMMLLILTSVLGYELKTAVGTSVFIMTFTAFTGAVSHFAIGGMPDLWCLVFCVGSTLLWARIAARFANKASPATLNRATGVVLVVLGVAIMGVNYIK